MVYINKILDFSKGSKCECFVFKVDFEKACDLISWSSWIIGCRSLVLTRGVGLEFTLVFFWVAS